MYAGLDKLALDALDGGLDGAVSIGGGSAMAEEFVSLAACHKRGDTEGARACHDKIVAWCAPSGEARAHQLLSLLSSRFGEQLWPKAHKHGYCHDGQHWSV